MGCGFSRLPGSRDQHEEDVSLHSIEPFAEHRETVNPDRSREVDQPERETDGPVESSSDVRIADVSSAQRRRANRSHPITVSSVTSANLVIYFL